VSECTFEFTDNVILEDLKKKLSRKKFDNICLTAAKIVQQSVKESASRLIPGDGRAVIDSIIAETYEKEGPHNAFVLADRKKAFWGLFYEYGTGPRIAKGKSLKTEDGKFLGKEVKPVLATHFFARGVNSAEKKAEKYLEEEAEKIIREKLRGLL